MKLNIRAKFHNILTRNEDFLEQKKTAFLWTNVNFPVKSQYFQMLGGPFLFEIDKNAQKLLKGGFVLVSYRYVRSF